MVLNYIYLNIFDPNEQIWPTNTVLRKFFHYLTSTLLEWHTKSIFCSWADQKNCEIKVDVWNFKSSPTFIPIFTIIDTDNCFNHFLYSRFRIFCSSFYHSSKIGLLGDLVTRKIEWTLFLVFWMIVGILNAFQRYTFKNITENILLRWGKWRNYGIWSRKR